MMLLGLSMASREEPKIVGIVVNFTSASAANCMGRVTTDTEVGKMLLFVVLLTVSPKTLLGNRRRNVVYGTRKLHKFSRGILMLASAHNHRIFAGHNDEFLK